MKGVSTYFALMAEYQTAEVPLEIVCDKYFSLSPDKAKRRAAVQQLPVPAHRFGSQKSGWFVSIGDLAKMIDEAREQATHLHNKMKTKAA